jgi:hypothetical protein
MTQTGDSVRLEHAASSRGITSGPTPRRVDWPKNPPPDERTRLRPLFVFLLLLATALVPAASAGIGMAALLRTSEAWTVTDSVGGES